MGEDFIYLRSVSYYGSLLHSLLGVEASGFIKSHPSENSPTYMKVEETTRCVNWVTKRTARPAHRSTFCYLLSLKHSRHQRKAVDLVHVAVAHEGSAIPAAMEQNRIQLIRKSDQNETVDSDV